MMLEWMADPTAWLGLATLIVLEVVLGIDNLVFIAILADKLPPEQRNRARVIGLALALIMRLGLLASIAWVVTLTAPLFSVFGLEISGRDLILIVGGGFLLFKATMELHERVEGGAHGPARGGKRAVFWHVIAQIVALDIVFSLDSVITAVGMVQELSIMMIAVVAAMAVMMLASRPLMAFIGRHPTVVILCLGLLLMIGFSLVAEGLGFHVPKGYLYAAIGFSILIEAFNQLARRNRGQGSEELNELAGAGDVRSIMVPRAEMEWLDTGSSVRDIVARFASGQAVLPLCEGDAGKVIGVLHVKDVLPMLPEAEEINLRALARTPHYVRPTTPVRQLPDLLRQSAARMLIVVDEHGVCQGLVTPMEVLTAMGGERSMASLATSAGTA